MNKAQGVLLHLTGHSVLAQGAHTEEPILTVCLAILFSLHSETASSGTYSSQQ